jgi:myo-inositol catabolism protein IolC
MALDIFARNDLIETGQWTEDGEREIAVAFYLVAEDHRGARVAHDFSVRAWRSDDQDAIARIEGLRARVAAHVAKGGKLDPDHWTEIDPAYGSEAYQALDAHGYFWGQEVLRAVEAGEPVSMETEAEARMYVGWAA